MLPLSLHSDGGDIGAAGSCSQPATARLQSGSPYDADLQDAVHIGHSADIAKIGRLCSTRGT